MSKAGAPRHDPVPIGEIANPPFARLPQPETLFHLRAERFRALAQGDLAPYLSFLAGISEAQHRIQDGLPDPDMPAEDAIRRASEFGMPPLDRNTFKSEPTFETTLDRMFALAADVEAPAMARAALARAAAADAAGRDGMVRNVLLDSIPIESLADHLYVAAALQVHFARMAARLDVKALTPINDGTCPSCGGPPVSSMVVGWTGAHGTRFCSCALCSTLWHVVRIKCVLCGSTKGITYEQIEGGSDLILAETCTECRGYVKILQQLKNPDLDPVADDVATLGLDLLVRETGFRRGGVNPFLLGY